MKKAIHTATKTDISRARKLRREMSNAELLLWRKLQELPDELGFTFRRQHPVHPYILDFACIKIKLAVELDGMSHDSRLAQDKVRDDYLLTKGYRTFRFANDEVFTNAEGVVETITREAKTRT